MWLNVATFKVKDCKIKNDATKSEKSTPFNKVQNFKNVVGKSKQRYGNSQTSLRSQWSPDCSSRAQWRSQNYQDVIEGKSVHSVGTWRERGGSSKLVPRLRSLVP